jgi:hypothetical protein
MPDRERSEHTTAAASFIRFVRLVWIDAACPLCAHSLLSGSHGHHCHNTTVSTKLNHARTAMRGGSCERLGARSAGHDEEGEQDRPGLGPQICVLEISLWLGCGYGRPGVVPHFIEEKTWSCLHPHLFLLFSSNRTHGSARVRTASRGLWRRCFMDISLSCC